MLQDKLRLTRHQHTEFNGYILKPQTSTDPSSKHDSTYLTRSNFGLAVQGARPLSTRDH
jgi:hypothetical protein